MSKVGNVRLDIAPETNRTRHGDLFNLSYIEQSFDTVICDPPHDYYVTGKNRFRWILKLADLARKKLIISIPKINIQIPEFSKEYFIIEEGRLAIKLWVIFTRKQNKLRE